MSNRALIEKQGLAASRPVVGRLGRKRLARHGVPVSVLVLLFAALYGAFELLRFYTFQSSAYDLVIFDEAVRSYAHFQPGIAIIKGLHNGFGPHFPELGDHWSPILAALAPLYWIYGAPQTLLIVQGVLFALAIPPLWLFTRRALGGGSRAAAAAYLVTIAYALSWPIASAMAFDFHEVAFVPLLTAVALQRLQVGQVRTALLALGALLLVKEDMGLLVAGVGCYLTVSRPRLNRQRQLGLGLIAAGIAATIVSIYVLIPAAGGRADYYWAYDALGHNPPQLAWHLIAHPLGSLRELVTPRAKLDTMLWLVGALCFLPLLSPISLAAVPLLLERMLASSFPNWWGTSYQYNAFVVMIFVCAAVDGAARLGRWASLARDRCAARHAESGSAESSDSEVATRPGPAARRRPGQAESQLSSNIAFGAAEVMLVLAVLLVPKFGFSAAFQPTFYHRNAQILAAAAAVAMVPAGVVVEATDQVGPQLSARDTVLLWDGDGHTPPLAASWVIANVSQRQDSFNTIGEQRQRVTLLRRSGYKIVFERDGYMVLHRSGLPAGHEKF